MFYAASGRSGVNVYVEAQFADGVKTTNTDYGLEKDKYVSKVTIRLREGDYDETDSTTQGGHLIRLEKINNPLKTASGSWSWEYK